MLQSQNATLERANTGMSMKFSGCTLYYLNDDDALIVDLQHLGNVKYYNLMHHVMCLHILILNCLILSCRGGAVILVVAEALQARRGGQGSGAEAAPTRMPLRCVTLE